MQSKNKLPPDALQREYLSIVKQLPCSCCGCPGPVDVHEMEQGKWWLSVSLCPSCHRPGLLGWHGQKRAWTLRKMTMLDALAKTIEGVFQWMKLDQR